MIGFEKKIFKESVDWVLIHCDLISRQENDVESYVLYSVSTVARNVSYPFQKEPLWLEFHPVNNSRIDSVRIRITDGRNNTLDLNGLDVALSLMTEEA